MTNKIFKHAEKPRPFTYIGKDEDNHVMKYDDKYVLVTDKVFSEMKPHVDLNFSFSYELYDDDFSLTDCMDFRTLATIPTEVKEQLESYLSSVSLDIHVKENKVILTRVNNIDINNIVLAEIK